MLLGDSYRCVGFVEKNELARKRLAENLPYLGGAAVFRNDIRTEDFTHWSGCVDIFTAGWPCQGYSTATRGRPTHEDLWPFVYKAVESSKPSFVFLENVRTAPWSVVENDLEQAGFRCERGVFCPSTLGATHKRPRTFLLAHSDRNSESLGPFNAEMAGVSTSTNGYSNWVPGAVRVADGAPGRMAKFRLAGEGCVPAVAALAFRDLAERLGFVLTV